MDLDLNLEQQDVLETIKRILSIGEEGESESAEESERVNDQRWQTLQEAGFLNILEPGVRESYLLAVLMIECAEGSPLRAPLGATALVAPYVGLDHFEAPVALASGDGSIARYAEQANTILMLESNELRVLSQKDVQVDPITSRTTYPLARVRVRTSRGRVLGSEAAARMRRAWRVLIATEMESAMNSAIDLACRYVSGRVQFDKPLGSLQAVQHRLASAHVAAAGSAWLARRAAWSMDEEWWPAVAACHAIASADSVFDSVHQVVGAIGFTKAFGLYEWTMALPVLKGEMGDPQSHAVAVTRLRNRSSMTRMAGS